MITLRKWSLVVGRSAVVLGALLSVVGLIASSPTIAGVGVATLAMGGYAMAFSLVGSC